MKKNKCPRCNVIVESGILNWASHFEECHTVKVRVGDCTLIFDEPLKQTYFFRHNNPYLDNLIEKEAKEFIDG